MNAFGRARARTVLLSGLSAVAIACAASFAFADPFLSPEAPPSFGDLTDASPLVALFTAKRAVRGPAWEANEFSWTRHREEPQGVEGRPSFRTGYGDVAIQSRRSGPASLDRFAFARDDGGASTPAVASTPSPPDSASPVYDPTAGPTRSSTQSALQAALWRLVARDDRRNPLGGGDWRAARGAIAAFYAARNDTPVWVSENGLTEAGRSALTGLMRARDDGLNLAFALPRDLESGLDPDAIAEAETIIASAVVVYAEQATGSRVRPSHVSPLIFAAPAIADPGVALGETAAAADPARRLADFNPPQRGYRALRDELKRLENSWRRRTTVPCPQRRP